MFETIFLGEQLIVEHKSNRSKCFAYCTATTVLCRKPANLCQIMSWIVWCPVSRGLWAMIIIKSALITIETFNVIWLTGVNTWNEDCNQCCGLLVVRMVPTNTKPSILPIPFISCALDMKMSWVRQYQNVLAYHMRWWNSLGVYCFL